MKQQCPLISVPSSFSQGSHQTVSSLCSGMTKAWRSIISSMAGKWWRVRFCHQNCEEDRCEHEVMKKILSLGEKDKTDPSRLGLKTKHLEGHWLFIYNYIGSRVQCTELIINQMGSCWLNLRRLVNTNWKGTQKTSVPFVESQTFTSQEETHLYSSFLTFNVQKV